jgi:hypothetical protein
MATVSDLTSAMFNVEGNNPNLASNNNPGNLVYVGQPGATLGKGGFAAYPSLEAGIAAANAQVSLNLSRGTCANGNAIDTLADMISCWSPANAPGNSPSSTSNYVSSVANQTGIDPSASLAAQLTSGGIQDTGASVQNSPDSLSTLSFDSFDLSSLLDPTQPYLYIGIAALALALYALTD